MCQNSVALEIVHRINSVVIHEKIIKNFSALFQNNIKNIKKMLIILNIVIKIIDYNLFYFDIDKIEINIILSIENIHRAYYFICT